MVQNWDGQPGEAISFELSGDGENFCACGSCRHRAATEFKCTAYPDGIPKEIILGQVLHEEPYAGDHGIQWEACAINYDLVASECEQTYDPLCVHCYAYNEGSTPPTCVAFPQGIPSVFWSGRQEHTEPYLYDGGIQYAYKYEIAAE